MTTYPKGTYVSSSKGMYTPSGYKHFVHVRRNGEFARSYPVWKSKNPNVRHLYEYQGRILPGNTVYSLIKSNSNSSSNSNSNTPTSRRRRAPIKKKNTTNNKNKKKNTTKNKKITKRKKSTPMRSFWV